MLSLVLVASDLSTTALPQVCFSRTTHCWWRGVWEHAGPLENFAVQGSGQQHMDKEPFFISSI